MSQKGQRCRDRTAAYIRPLIDLKPDFSAEMKAGVVQSRRPLRSFCLEKDLETWWVPFHALSTMLVRDVRVSIFVGIKM